MGAGTLRFWILIAVFSALTALTFCDPWIDFLSSRLGSMLFPEATGTLGDDPLHERSGYRAIQVGAFRTDAIGLVWPDIVRPVHVLIALLLLFHAVLWPVMADRRWRWAFRSIDYIWYLGAAVALVMAAADFVVNSAFNKAYIAAQQYAEAKARAAPIVGGLKKACDDPGTAVFEIEGQRVSLCMFALDAPGFWENDNPLCEQNLMQGGRFDAVETWRSGSGQAIMLSRSIDPVACAERPQEFATCRHIERIADMLIGPAQASQAESAGPYDLGYLRMLELEQRYAPAVDAFRMCRLMAAGREIAREIGDNTKVQLAAAGLDPFRGSWLMILAFAIAIRLVKTTADVRDDWPFGRLLPVLPRSRALLLPAGAAVISIAAFAAFSLGVAGVSDGWTVPFIGWPFPIVRWIVYLFAGLPVLGCVAGLLLAPWLVDGLDPADAAADQDARGKVRAERSVAVRIASVVGLIMTDVLAAIMYGWA